MSEIVVLHVPEPAVDAAVAGSRVWCAAGGRLMAFEAGSGDQQADLAAPPGIVSLAASDAVLAGVSKSGVVHVLDPATGQERYRWPLGSEVDLRGEAGSVWAVDHRFQRLWMLPPDGRPTRAVPAPGVEEVAPHGERVFWASRGDTFLHGGDRLVDLGVGPRGSGRDGRLRGLPLDQRARRPAPGGALGS